MTDGDMAAARVRREAAGFADTPEFEVEVKQPWAHDYREPSTWKLDAWECRGCGALVLDPDRHIDHHDRIGDPL